MEDNTALSGTAQDAQESLQNDLAYAIVPRQATSKSDTEDKKCTGDKLSLYAADVDNGENFARKNLPKRERKSPVPVRYGNSATDTLNLHDVNTGLTLETLQSKEENWIYFEQFPESKSDLNILHKFTLASHCDSKVSCSRVASNDSGRQVEVTVEKKQGYSTVNDLKGSKSGIVIVDSYFDSKGEIVSTNIDDSDNQSNPSKEPRQLTVQFLSSHGREKIPIKSLDCEM